MKFRPNFLKRTKGVFLVCEKFRENAVMGAVLPLFYFVCKLSAKRKNPKGSLRFFVLAGFFIFKIILRYPFCVPQGWNRRCDFSQAYMPA